MSLKPQAVETNLPGFRISQKAMLLVAVPLVFELLFLFILSNLQQQAETTAEQAMHIKDVTAETNSIITLFYESVNTLVTMHLYNNYAENHHFEDQLTLMPARLARLRKLVSDDPYELGVLDSIEPDMKGVMTFMMTIKESMRGNESEAAIARFSRWNDEIRLPFRHLMSELQALVEYQKRKMNALPEAELRARQMVRDCLMAGVVVNIVIAVFLTIGITRGITSRLEKLTRNTVKLANQETLEPPEAGNDEIGRLDVCFHLMAQSLKDAAAKERQMNERIRAVVENMLVGVVTVNEDGVMESVNPRIEELLGVDRQQLADKNLCQYLFVKRSGDLSVSRLKELAFNRIAELKAHQVSQDGGEPSESFPIEVTLTELEQKDGKRFLVNILDVTERYEVERMKREFVAMVSHDLRTPLSSVLSSMTLLQSGAMGTLTERGEQLITESERELGRLVKLINDLLDVAKMEAGKFDLKLVRTDLDQIIFESMLAVKGLADSKKISINYEETGFMVLGDSDRLVQVVINLLSNALKFSPEEAEITVASSQSKEWLEVSVTDTGQGVPPDFQDVIFERYAQAAGAEKQGTGLGLAICKAIIEGHKGHIGVESTTQGARFWFRLPIG